MNPCEESFFPDADHSRILLSKFNQKTFPTGNFKHLGGHCHDQCQIKKVRSGHTPTLDGSISFINFLIKNMMFLEIFLTIKPGKYP